MDLPLEQVFPDPAAIAVARVLHDLFMFRWTLSRAAIGIAVGVAVSGFAMVAYRQGWSVAKESAAVAATLLIVVIGGRWTAVRDARWATVHGPVSATMKVHRGRVVVRRVDVFSSVMLGVVGVGWAATLWLAALDWVGVSVVLACAFMGPLFVMFAIPALAHKVVVTPAHLTIHRAFSRSVVPRHTIRTVRRGDAGALVVETLDGGSAKIPTGISSLFVQGNWNHRPAQLKAAGRLEAAFAALPPAEAADSDTVTTRPRITLIIIAVAAAACFATLTALVYTDVVKDAPR
ncbi:hypothetical protein Cme02nite_76020 [Catellatospora methionotrophica]|uniref:PH domain-containing protein n=1 Tax=Catellatospora methionotrophica TaxID=121620 RepID=A0A8J3LR17_9ACTN|nr:hypothetical protein [Catellatospora methionotrophica]GIG19270.1 hypothetical protein Cme02nite_76020 [Catellatospora methionotrophica]